MKYDETQPTPDDADQGSDTGTSKPAEGEQSGDAKPEDNAGQIGN